MQVRGGVVQSWDTFDPLNIYGVMPAAAVGGQSEGATGDMNGLAGTVGPSLFDAHGAKPWHPDSPMFWFGLLAATTFGLVAASTSIRVGPFKASVAAGKS